MKRFLRKRHECLVFGMVALVLMMSLSWFWRARLEVRRIKAIAATIHLPRSDYQPSTPVATVRPLQSWPNPVAQSAGDVWIYELFTPPTVFYNPKSAAFSVTPPTDLVRVNPAFNLELIAVKRELYRLQLTGYFGEPGAYNAIFTQPDKAETLLAHEGEKFEGLGLTLRSFSVKRLALEHTDAWPVYEWAAVAELDDERSGAKIILDSRQTKFAEASVAIMRITSPGELGREVREGDVISNQGKLYRIEHIQHSPAEVRVACEGSDRVLRPSAVDLNYVAAAHKN